jgi:hypothetical protein
LSGLFIKTPCEISLQKGKSKDQVEDLKDKKKSKEVDQVEDLEI